MFFPKKTFSLIASWRSPLSVKIIVLLFISLFFIEGILLIPSLRRQQDKLLAQIDSVSVGKLMWLLQNTQKVSPAEFSQRFQELQQVSPQILGGAIYDSQGQLVSKFGEPPALELAQPDQDREDQYYSGSRYDKAWRVSELPVAITNHQLQDHTLILRHNAASVDDELHGYLLRVLGLVIIIAAFTTVTLWLALEPIVIKPILQLKRDLLKAGEAVSKDQAPPQFDSATLKRNDELGEVITAFEAMFMHITKAISNRKLAETALQKSLNQLEEYSEKLDADLQEGRQMQQNFLPDAEGISCLLLKNTRWKITACFQPARQVSGDFYDAFKLPGGHLGLVIADVCGKGVSAALFMALFRSLIRIYSTEPVGQGKAATDEEIKDQALQAVSLTNNYIAKHHGDLGMFATLFFGVLDAATGSVTYINGGHEALLILNAQGGIRETLRPTGPAVGMFPDQKFEICQSYLYPGEILLGYTDGITDARAANGAFYTRKRLLSLLNSSSTSAVALLHQITTSVLAHRGDAEQFDDMTLLAVQRSV